MLEAIDALSAVDAAIDTGTTGPEVDRREAGAVADLEEELGDLLFQVYFHATLAAEEGRFSLADVARGVHDKLVSRHPHVFGDVTADTADDVATNWEALKKLEKGRSSVTEGIPRGPPVPGAGGQAAAQGGGHRHGAAGPGRRGRARWPPSVAALAAGAGAPGATADVADGEGGARDRAEAVGELLFAVVGVSRALGVDPETALLARSGRFRAEVGERG